MKLRLTSKRLSSGRFQVNFSAGTYYGYLLAEPSSTVVDVVDKIRRHVHAMDSRDSYFQRNLFSVCSRNVHSGRILLFSK